jgi:hypothetical protein
VSLRLPRICEVVSIAEKWRFDGAVSLLQNLNRPTVVENPDQFEFRGLDCLVGLAIKSYQSYEGKDLYTTNKFKCSLDNPRRITALSDSQWLSAKNNILERKELYSPELQMADSAVATKASDLGSQAASYARPSALCFHDREMRSRYRVAMWIITTSLFYARATAHSILMSSTCRPESG